MDDLLLHKIVGFINDTGIECKEGTLPESTFLPGVDIKDGRIVYDKLLLRYPGDLLHEAGHIAVLLPHDRRQAQSPDKLFGDVDPAAAEMAAIAWSWAALQHLQIPPEVVFHEHGYKGGSSNIIENFSAGRYFAVPYLQWLGMTAEPKHPVPASEYTYPKMKHWLRPEKKSG